MNGVGYRSANPASAKWLPLTGRQLAASAVLAAAWLWACDERPVGPGTNASPVGLVSQFDTIRIAPGSIHRLDATGVFSDPNGDGLVITAAVSDADLAVVTVEDGFVEIVALGTGKTGIVVTATDPGGLAASVAGPLELGSAPVALVEALESVSVLTGDEVSIPVAASFNDPDDDPLVFSAALSDPAVATASVSGDTVRVVGVEAGVTTLTVIATDSEGLSASISGEVEVLDARSQERRVLEIFYHATDGPNWVDNTNWLSDRPVGDWYGVNTDASGRVVRLHLNGSWDFEADQNISHGLRGELPVELGNLTELTRLHLRNNDLTGPIPAELGNLANLWFLDLAHNNFTGPIPAELGNLANLRFLDLFFTALTGPIPVELGNLVKLEFLALLSEDGFSGPIPPELGNLVNLRSLILGTGLTGSIPPELVELANLSHLDLRGNNLSGPIPPWLGELANLQVLTLITNQFTGSIPPELGNLNKLGWLNLWRNDLTGPVPPELGNLVNLRHLGLGQNRLTGTIPRTFLNLAELESLDWSCGIRGICVPGTSDFVAWVRRMEDTNWGSGPYCNASDQAVLTRLYEVTAGDEWTESGRWLSGPALEEWHGVETDSLGRVTALDLSGQGLSGVLPAGIANLGRLTSLRIDGNKLEGRLPLALTALDLDTLHYDGTDLCEPTDAEFRAWLDGIPSRRGTGLQCAPLTDRDALVALYEATGGPGWTNSGGWLTEAPLRLWPGVEVDTQGRVVGLDLDGNRLSGAIPPELAGLANLESLSLPDNDLSGAIPPELGDLANLKRLYLQDNELSGAIPPELGGLANLRQLSLPYNDLSGAIPPELGDLSNLRSLFLDENDLAGTIPPELGNLSNLRWLSLSRNDFSGAIPPELGDLSNLRSLSLSRNDLSGAIPPELGDLSNLWSLFLDENDLAGAIPPELGDLSNLRYLSLGGNALSGAIPPTFGALADLIVLELSHNPGLAGAMPAGLRNLALESLLASGTELCVPRESVFEEWLATIPRRRIAACGEPPAAYLVQAVQSRAHPVPLVAGEDALLRVFVTAAMETTEGIPEVRARFYLNGSERHVADIAGHSTPIPTEIDEGNLSKSANAEIPGWIVRPGLEMVVEIDPGGALDPGLGVPKRIPEVGRMTIDVREMPTLDLTVIPFLWSSDPDSAIIALVNGMEDDPEGHHLLEDTHVLLPVAVIDVTARAPVASTSNFAYDLLLQTEAIRVLEGGAGHYMGMMSGPALATDAGGIAYLPGRSSFSRPRSSTLAHELGHNMGLGHAPCGLAGGPDPSFPYPTGFIGAWGYDFHVGRLVSPESRDHMSYCGPPWTSDYHFTNALAYRLRDEGASAAPLAAGPARSLLLWGGVDTTSTPFLNPAFVADAAPALPDSAGDYTVTGRDASGRELFSLSFAMPVAVSEEAEVSSFVFALPVQPVWADALASVTLSGPAGTATLDGDSDIPMAILRDPRTGQVRGILRDPFPATQAAANGIAAPGGQGLEVLFSRGIPRVEEWRR